MGRTTNFRSKIDGIICTDGQRPETQKVIRILDALEAAGVPEVFGFCNRVAEATVYSLDILPA